MDFEDKVMAAFLVSVYVMVAFWLNFGLFLLVHGNTFYHSKPVDAKALFVRYCKDSVQGSESGVPDVHTNNWTCAIPKGETK